MKNINDFFQYRIKRRREVAKHQEIKAEIDQEIRKYRSTIQRTLEEIQKKSNGFFEFQEFSSEEEKYKSASYPFQVTLFDENRRNPSHYSLIFNLFNSQEKEKNLRIVLSNQKSENDAIFFGGPFEEINSTLLEHEIVELLMKSTENEMIELFPDFK